MTTTALYRHHLPQLGDRLFLTDGGLETTLVFHDGMDLPCFASFPLLDTEAGLKRLRDYYARYAMIAVDSRRGFVLEAPTWRANPDWGRKLGYDLTALDDVNRRAITLMEEIRWQYANAASPMVISGNLGPRGDGYQADGAMTAKAARDYHARQIEVFASTAADMIAAFTMTYADEAIGIVHAARTAGLPSAISFTLETDGRLPSGDTLADAIARVDDATSGAAAYYMINCAHPTHFEHELGGGNGDKDDAWLSRIRGVRANASKKSHAELDNSIDLDAGDPAELGREIAALRRALPSLAVLGGCCGTDHRHVEEIGFSCREAA
jgi:S-methylmethionine-dependent homocysteine/selenocysteine methylase